MNEIKIVISDLDGTLLNKDSEVSDYTKQVINEIIDEGVLFVPCTGRSISQIPKWLLEHDKIKFIGSANGAMLHTTHGEKSVYEKRIDLNTTRKVIGNLKEYLKYSTVIFDGHYYSLKEMHGISHLYDQDYMAHVKDTIQFLDSYEELLNESEVGIEKIHFGFPSIDPKEELFKHLEKNSEIFKGVHVTSSHISNIEMMHEDANKGSVAKYLLEHFNLSKENLLVLGDNLNDVSMLECAKYKVAMDNAEEEIKNIATHIADHHDEDGAAKMISKLVLNK